MALAQRPAEIRVHFGELALLAEPLAIGRIHGDEPARGRRIGQRRELAALDDDEALEARRRGVRLRGADRAGVAIVAADREMLRARRRAPVARLVEQAAPERRIVTAPTQESEILAPKSRCGVGRDRRGLDAERARPAHRIDEAERLAVGRRRRDERRPARAQQNRGREILLQRRGALRAAVAAPMQALARQVDRERRDVAVDV